MYYKAQSFDEAFPGVADIKIQWRTNPEIGVNPKDFTPPRGLRQRWPHTGAGVECGRSDCQPPTFQQHGFDLYTAITAMLTAHENEKIFEIRCAGSWGSRRMTNAAHCTESKEFKVQIIESNK
jgi:hypothetical protein